MSNLGDVVLTHGEYTVRGPMPITAENIERLWQQAKQYPIIFGKEVLGNSKDFIELFVNFDDGKPEVNGLFYVINDFLGVFYLTDIVPGEDANAHYTFFDRRHNGRRDLVVAMLKYVFEKYQFQRLSAQIPNYATKQARHFAQACGFMYEGKRRKAAPYKGDRFDVNLYGILRSEVLKDG